MPDLLCPMAAMVTEDGHSVPPDRLGNESTADPPQTSMATQERAMTGPKVKTV